MTKLAEDKKDIWIYNKGRINKNASFVLFDV